LRQARKAIDGLLGLVLNQAGHCHRAAGRNFQRRFGAAGLDRRNGRSTLAAGQRVFRRDFRHFGHHPKADPSLRQHDRRKVEGDAEFFEADGLDALSDAATRC
jgi:hypothetical protein